MKKKNIDSHFHTVTCSGCGRYTKVVDKSTSSWYCSDCFLGNYNFFRKQNNKALIKVVSLHKNDKVLCTNGKKYTILGKSYIMGKTQYYNAVETDSKDKTLTFVGDYQVEKVL